MVLFLSPWRKTGRIEFSSSHRYDSFFGFSPVEELLPALDRLLISMPMITQSVIESYESQQRESTHEQTPHTSYFFGCRAEGDAFLHSTEGRLCIILHASTLSLVSYNLT